MNLLYIVLLIYGLLSLLFGCFLAYEAWDYVGDEWNDSQMATFYFAIGVLSLFWPLLLILIWCKHLSFGTLLLMINQLTRDDKE